MSSKINTRLPAIFQNLSTNFQADQEPSTSHHCQKQIISPKICKRNRVNRFKKILDDQARRLVKRSVYIVRENHHSHKLVTPQKKSNKRLINHTNSNRKRKIIKRKSKDLHIVSTLEEGEIRSETNRSEENETIRNLVDEEDDDDCVVIEPTLEEITIDDDDENEDIDNDDDNDDGVPSNSDISTNYQSLVNSFKERISSTPCHNKNSSPSYAAVVKDFTDTEETLHYFVDIVGRKSGIESINSTENFIDTKLSTLVDKTCPSERSVRLKRTTTDDEIIDLDETVTDNAKKSTSKRKSDQFNDDSVIFVSETNKNDFISIVDNNNVPPNKILKLTDCSTPKTPGNRLRTNLLFTQSETKKLTAYNENTYNPSANEELASGKRMVIIDGSNVAFKHGLDQLFSVRGLKIALDYFEKMGHDVKAVIPQFRMNKNKSSDPDELERLHKAGRIVQTPCKNLPGHTSTSYDDRFILQLAYELDAAVVSNDNYRDLLHENPAFKKIIENRVIGYTWCNDIFIIPKDPYGKWGPSLSSILNR